MKRFFSVLLTVAFLFSTLAQADEGMWLYNAPPKDKIKAKYGFELTQQWLDHVRLSSVRFNNGGSGSFVSADGLTFTNHHVGAGCVQQLSSEGHDYIKTGFYAKTQAEEAKCPNLELNQLVGIQDVTDKVNAGVKADMSAADAGQAQRAAMSQVEKDCSTSTGLRCDVVTFYSGQVYNLYKYKKYTDVRLVFAPEFDIAFFGGDPDNFTYPRYDLDITFFRVYENDKPAHLDNYLQWSRTGVKDGDLIFVSGHPGSTGRLLTMAQLEFLRDVQYPALLKMFARRISLLQNFSKESDENARIAKEDIFGLQNSQKAITGYQSGLLDKSIMDTKAADEAKLRAAFKADPKNAGAADPWDEIAQAIKVQQSIYPSLTYLERMRGFCLASGPRRTVAGTRRRRKTKTEPGAHARVPRFELAVVRAAAVLHRAHLQESRDRSAHRFARVRCKTRWARTIQMFKRCSKAKHPRRLPKDLIANTRLDDVAVRKQLYEGGETAIEASTDPLIVAMRAIDPSARAVRKQFRGQGRFRRTPRWHHHCQGALCPERLCPTTGRHASPFALVMAR